MMMISQPAWWCLQASIQRLLRPHQAEPEDEPVSPLSLTPLSRNLGSEPGHESVAATPDRGSSHFDAPVTPLESLSGPLTVAERRARAAALRALALSRGRCFDAARSAFTDAATLDPALDLTRTPAFWKLERAAHEAAIDAYTAAGRDRDAAVLRARVRSTYRPKALRTRPEAVFTP